MLDVRARLMQSIQSKRLDPTEKIHFLHIGKNAGTQISHFAEQINKAQKHFKILKQPHKVSLHDLPRSDRYFFSVRDPVTRFKSGFYSRKRKGHPRLHSEWSAHEAQAFNWFDHANDLAEALFETGERGDRAFAAIKSITHCSMNQVDWFVSRGAILTVRPPVYVIRQEHFATDIRKLAQILLPGFCFEQSDDDHRSDYGNVPPLSERAVNNLRRWYAQDLEFYRHIERWLEGQS
jgi:hypothetical protein